MGEVIERYMVSIDPGLRASGFACWRNGELVESRAILVDNGEDAEQWQAMAQALEDACPSCHIACIAVEVMRLRGKLLAAVPRLLQLAYTTGAFLGSFYAESKGGPRVHLVDPHVWTNGLDKAKNEPRIRRALSEAEADVLDAALAVTPKANIKEVIDAVGIGLFSLGRL